MSSRRFEGSTAKSASLALLAACAFPAGGCSRAAAPARPAPQVFTDLHAAACSGDTDRVFAIVDGPRFMTNWARRVAGLPVSPLGSTGTPGTVTAVFTHAGRRLLTVDACAWSFLSSEPAMGGLRVTVWTRRGNHAVLSFARENGALRLVDQDEPEALPRPGARPPVARRSDAPIGVTECDDYLARWKDCHPDPVDRPDLDRLTAGLRGMALDPEDWGELARICKLAQESLPSRCSGEHAI